MDEWKYAVQNSVENGRGRTGREWAAENFSLTKLCSTDYGNNAEEKEGVDKYMRAHRATNIIKKS